MSLAWAGFAESCEFDAHVHACTCAQAMDPGHGTHVFITVLSTIYTPLPPQTPYKVEMESSQPHTPPPMGLTYGCFRWDWVGLAVGLMWVGWELLWAGFGLGLT
jgi:hypothetical protein